MRDEESQKLREGEQAMSAAVAAMTRRRYAPVALGVLIAHACVVARSSSSFAST